MNRRGQFYLIDAFFAAAILFLGLALLVQGYVGAPDTTQGRLTAQDVTTLLYDQPIGDLNSPYIVNNYAILDEERTVIDQIHVWKWNTSCGWCQTNATALVQSVVTAVIPPQQGVSVSVAGAMVYNRSVPTTPQYQIVDTQVIVTSVNSSLLIGPTTSEVRIWQ